MRYYRPKIKKPMIWDCPKCGRSSVKVHSKKQVKLVKCSACGFLRVFPLMGPPYEDIDYYNKFVDSYYDEFQSVLKEDMRVSPDLSRKLERARDFEPLTKRRPIRYDINVIKGGIFEVTIYDHIFGDYYGYTGLAKIGNTPVFVPRTMKGDKVIIRIKSILDGSFAVGELLRKL